jgi:uncharacterized SAM-binding protein YcdF (DUF218 family)
MSTTERTNREARKLLLATQAKEDRKVSKPRTSSSGGKKWQPSWRDGVAGLVLGVLSSIALLNLGLIGAIPYLRGDHVYGIGAVVGQLLGITRLRGLPWVAAASSAAGILVVGYTPLVKPLIRACVRTDKLHPVEAVVVLSSDIFPDAQPTDVAQIRLLRGYEVIREGYAKRLVLTRLRPPKQSYEPAVEAQMQRLNIDFTIEETEPVSNTHDEAVEVARLAKARGWKEIILVSDPIHLRRAGAVFEKQGLKVMCTPCIVRNYDLEDLSAPGQRINAFRDWIWEWGGMQVYKRNGWI